MFGPDFSAITAPIDLADGSKVFEKKVNQLICRTQQSFIEGRLVLTQPTWTLTLRPALRTIFWLIWGSRSQIGSRPSSSTWRNATGTISILLNFLSRVLSPIRYLMPKIQLLATRTCSKVSSSKERYFNIMLLKKSPMKRLLNITLENRLLKISLEMETLSSPAPFDIHSSWAVFHISIQWQYRHTSN